MDDIRSEKRSRFAAEQAAAKKKKTILYIGIPLAFVAIVGAALYFLGGNSGGSADPGAGLRRSSGIFTTVTPENGAVTLPVANFQDGKAHFYTYKSGAKEIDFFVLKSSDGVIRAAADSCDVCFPYKKGYHQEGDEMVCNNCGQRFPSVKINEIKGGCNPAPLTRTVNGDSLTITEKDIVADGGQYF